MTDHASIVPIPGDADELKHQLGRAILAHSFQVMGWEMPDGLVERAPRSKNIAAANRWLTPQADTLEELRRVAAESLRLIDESVEAAMTSFMSRFMSSKRLRGLLGSSPGGYFARLLDGSFSDSARFTQLMRLFATFDV